MSERRWLAVLVLALALPLGGCLIEPLPDEPVRLAFSVEVPPSGTRAVMDTFTPWDTQGYFQLAKFPKLVRVAVEVKELELKSATWPDAAHGIGAGESSNGEVGVELQVQAGTQRRLRALGWLVDGQIARAYEETGTLTVDLVAGKTVAVDLPMIQRRTGVAAITVRCQAGNGGLWRPRGVALADARALVLFPEQPLVEDTSGALQVELDVPIVRYHWVRTILERIDTKEIRYIDKRQQTFVTSTTEKTPVNLTLPCEML